jgi:putative methyltransferase (TIGR04325 family)
VYRRLYLPSRDNCGYGCFRGVFNTFEEAIASTPPTKPIGYDNPRLAADYKATFSSDLRPYDYPVLFWLGKLIADGTRIFDFGGNVGTHYLAYREYLDFPAGLRWIVCDLPAIVQAGRRLAEELAVDSASLSFTETFGAADGADVLLASGSVQSLEAPTLADALSRLSRKPAHLLLNRLPLYSGGQFVTLQNGGSVFYPQLVFNERDFVGSLRGLGYELVDKWQDPTDSCFIPFHPDRSLPYYHGLYLTLRSIVGG